MTVWPTSWVSMGSRSILASACLLFSAYSMADTVLVLGDSISAGYGLKTGEGWVSQLDQWLARSAQTQRFGKSVVINASVSGETSRGGLLRLPKLLATYQPDVLIVELGGNDGLRGQPPALMQQNLASIISQSQKSGAKVLLLGMQIPPNYGKAYTQAFASSYPKLATQYKVSLVPFFLDGVAQNPRLMQDDRIHPNAQAQPILLKHVQNSLPTLLMPSKKTSASSASHRP